MADPRNTMLCEYAQWRSRIHHHNIEWQWRCFHQRGNQSDIRQTGREDPIRTRLRVCECSLNRLIDHWILMFFRRFLEENVCPSINEELSLRLVGHAAGASDAVCLIGCLPKFPTTWKAVFQIAPYGASLYGQTDGCAHSFRRVAVAAFEVHRHR